jgi:hypothetical protein
MGVAGVEAEADAEVADAVPEAGDGVEVASHGVVAAGGVLEVDGHLGLDGLEAPAPAGHPVGHAVVLGDVAPVDHHGPGPDLRGGIAGLLEDLARRDADLVVRRRQVDQVGRVDVDGEVGGSQLGRVGPGLRGLPRLRVAQEDLDAVRALGLRGGEGVGGADVGTDEHEAILRGTGRRVGRMGNTPLGYSPWPATR